MDARPAREKALGRAGLHRRRRQGDRRFPRRRGQGRTEGALQRRRLRPDERGRPGRLQAHARGLPRRADRTAAEDAGLRVDSRRLASPVARHQGQAGSRQAARPEGRRRPERDAGHRDRELPALRPAGVPGRSLRGLLLWARLRAAGTLLRRRRRRRLGEEPDAVVDAVGRPRPGGRARRGHRVPGLPGQHPGGRLPAAGRRPVHARLAIDRADRRRLALGHVPRHA